MECVLGLCPVVPIISLLGTVSCELFEQIWSSNVMCKNASSTHCCYHSTRAMYVHVC